MSFFFEHPVPSVKLCPPEPVLLAKALKSLPALTSADGLMKIYATLKEHLRISALCDAIDEEDSRLRSYFSAASSVRANWENISRNLNFRIWRIVIVCTEEIQTDMDSHRVICLIQPFATVISADDGMQGNPFGKVIHISLAHISCWTDLHFFA